MYYTSREYIEIVISALSGTTGVKAIAGDNWAFDVKNKVLRYNPLDLTQRPHSQVKGLVIHEMGHCIYTVTEESGALFKQFPRLQDAYNVFEDIRIESRLVQAYGDFASFPLYDLTYSALSTIVKGGGLVKGDPLDQALLMTLILTENGRTFKGSIWQTVQTHFGYFDFTKFIHPEAMAVLNKMISNDVFDEWFGKTISSKSFRRLQDFVDKDVYPYIKDLLEKYPKKGGEGEGQPGGQPGEAVPVPSSATPMGGFALNASESGQIKIPTYTEASATMKAYSSVLAQRLTDVLAEKRAVRYSGLHKKGKLLSKNAARVAFDEVRIFSKRNNPDTPYNKIYISLDGSGSMNDNQKASYAYLAAVMLYDIAIRMKMPIEVWEFGNSAHLIATEGHMKTKFMEWSANGGGTNDREGIARIAAKVKRDPEEPIVFIIGDGDGNGLNQSDVKTITDKGYMMGIGIGAGSDGVAKRYPNGVVVPEPKDVPKVILQTLRGLIRR